MNIILVCYTKKWTEKSIAKIKCRRQIRSFPKCVMAIWFFGLYSIRMTEDSCDYIYYLSFQLICSYVFYPISFFMGTETADCRKVAELIGVKTFTNEFIAYTQLKDLIANRLTLDNYTVFFNTTEWRWEKENIILDITGEVLKGGVLSVLILILLALHLVRKKYISLAFQNVVTIIFFYTERN